ncbi:MAG: hypothetical protein ABI844_19520 [Saprospiraceae bacterium]
MATFGPGLGRPFVDTLSGSDYSKMKELRLGVENGMCELEINIKIPENQSMKLAEKS